MTTDDELAAERAAAAEEVSRWERQISDAVVNLLDRQQGIVLARLTGVKARKNTRHWSPPGEAKVDPRYVLDAGRWAAEAAASMRGIFGRLASSAAEKTKAALTKNDEPDLPAALEQMVNRRIDYVAKKLQEFGAKVQALIEEMDAGGKSMPEIEAAVKALYAKHTPAMAKNIAATQAASAHNEASYAQALLSGAEVKQWLSSRDERVRPTHVHADGQRRRMMMPFRLGGVVEQPLISMLQFPGDPTGPPHEVMNCRCTMLFSLELEDADLGPLLNTDLWPLDSLAGEEKALPKTQVCKYCDAPATKRLLWAEGMAYIPVCDDHEAKGRHRIEVENHDEVLKVMAIAPVEEKADHVRTPEGVRKYGEPIGSPIVRDAAGNVIHAATSAVGKAGTAKAPSLFEQKPKAPPKTPEELLAEADDIAARMVAKAEKSEPYITPMIEQTVDAHGGWMEGLENRLKTHESTKRKILVRAEMKHSEPSSAAAGIGDVLRYTAVMPHEDYSAGVKATLDKLGAAGFHPSVTNNYWAKGDAYSGLNILMSGRGQTFEVQFHTPESFEAKDANHLDYEVSRDHAAPLEDRMAAWDRMVAAWDKVPQPAGWTDFGPFFIYDAPGQGTGRGRYVDKWTAQGIPKPEKPKGGEGDGTRLGHRWGGVFKMTDGHLFPWSKDKETP